MKMAQSTIQIRVDAKTKKEARKTLEELGIDLSSAIKLFLNNVVITQSIPLNLRTENGFTIEQENEMVKEAENAGREGGKFSTVKELMLDLEN